MPNSKDINSLETAIKNQGWKKLAGSFYVDLNDDTMAHFGAPYFKGTTLRVQCGTTNKRLNRVSWDVFGLPPNFGTKKDHLVSSAQCMLAFTYDALEFDPVPSDEKGLAAEISLFCRSKSEPWSSIEKIRAGILALPDRQRYASDNEFLCVEIAEKNFSSARAIIARNKANGFPGFELSFFAHAEAWLNKHAQQ